MVKYLILGPGGMVGIKFLGVLVKLKELGELGELQEISGSSVGSLIALFYIAWKGDLDRVVRTSLEFDIKKYTKPNVKNLISKYGLIDTGLLKKEMIKLVGDMTFKELYEIHPIKLHINAFEVLSNKTVYMSTDSTPNLSVVTAVLRSISIPIIFTPITTDTQIFIDGSTIELVPAEPFIGFNDVLEIRMIKYNSEPSKKPKTFLQYLFLLVGCLLGSRRTFDEFKRIDVQGTDQDVINFQASWKERTRMYLEGYTVEINCH